MPGGRPTKLTPELHGQVCDALRRGAYLETAAALAGIDRTTLQEWLRRGGREEDGAYVEFSRAVQSAQAEAEMRDLDRIDAAAAAGAWQASAWRLERKRPNRWGRPGSLHATAPFEGTEAEVVELVRCPSCADDQLPDKKLCGNCGLPMPQVEKETGAFGC